MQMGKSSDNAFTDGEGALVFWTLGLSLPFILWWRRKQGKKTKRSVKIWAGVIYGVVAAMLVSGAIVGEPVNNAKKNGTLANISKQGNFTKMPNLMGISLFEADEIFDETVGNLKLRREVYDLLYDAGIWNTDNWQVVRQSPDVGTLLVENQKICLGVRKKKYNTEPIKYKLPQECEQPRGSNSWPPNGGWIPTDSDQIALNPDYNPTDQEPRQTNAVRCSMRQDNYTFISNTGRGDGIVAVGTRGRCWYKEYIIRNSCRDVLIRYQWLTGGSEVIGLSTEIVGGPLVANQKFESIVFLPDSAWSGPTTGVKAHQVRCNR
jgi:hypothetical protein